MSGALVDVLAGRASTWDARARQVAELVQAAEPLVAELGHLTEVRMTGEDVGPLVSLARTLRDHLSAGGRLKTGPDGTPRIGRLTAKPVKHAEPLFARVRVDGLPPTTVARLDAFLTWVEATRLLDALDRAWPVDVHIPPEDTLPERLQWHRTELDQLERLLRLARELDEETGRVERLRLPRPDWSDLASVRAYADLVDAAAATDDLTAAQEPLRALEQVAGETAGWDDSAPAARELAAAVRERDPNRYARAHDRLRRLHRVRELVARRDGLATRLSAAAPALWEAVERGDDSDAAWRERLAGFTEAWRWAAIGAWLRDGVGRRAGG